MWGPFNVRFHNTTSDLQDQDRDQEHSCKTKPPIFSDVVNWSRNNLMNINWNKTKEMWIGMNTNLSTNVLCVNDNLVERVYSFKLLGIMIDYNLKWSAHIDWIWAKASSRLYF